MREARDTRYHRLLVVDDEDSRFMRFDNSFQSGMYLNDPFRTRFDYTDYLHLGLAYTTDAERVLFIGLGGGSAPEADVAGLSRPAAAGGRARPRRRRPPPTVGSRSLETRGSSVDVEDGRRFLRSDDGSWDVIVIDAYYADAIPFHLATVEFVELVDRGSPRAAPWWST